MRDNTAGPASRSRSLALVVVAALTVGGICLLLTSTGGSSTAAPLPPGPVLTISEPASESATVTSSTAVTSTSVTITSRTSSTSSPAPDVSHPPGAAADQRTSSVKHIVKTTAHQTTAVVKPAVVHGRPLTVVLPWTTAPIDDSTVSDDGGVIEPPHDPTHIGIWVPGATLADTTGTVLIAGHINYGGVQGAFSQLATLKPGDVVTTSDDVGVVTRWKVDKTYSVSKSGSLPAEIFTGKSSTARRLILVTCGGAFDSANRNYLDNVIAELIPAPLPQKRKTP